MSYLLPRVKAARVRGQTSSSPRWENRAEATYSTGLDRVERVPHLGEVRPGQGRVDRVVGGRPRRLHWAVVQSGQTTAIPTYDQCEEGEEDERPHLPVEQARVPVQPGAGRAAGITSTAPTSSGSVSRGTGRPLPPRSRGRRRRGSAAPWRRTCSKQ